MKLILLVILLLCLLALPAQASFCRQLDEHLICIHQIKRSAKYYWEYRASVSIDGQKRPMEVYNCRRHIRIQKDGTIIPFEPNGAGSLICNTIAM